MKNIITRVVVWFLVLGVAGCQSAGSGGGFWSSPVKVGDEIVIKKDIPVSAGKARVYLQHGRVAGGSNDFEPFCYFRMDQPLPVSQTIRPGVLKIYYVSLLETDVAREMPVRFAGLSARVGGGDRTPIAHQFHIGLKSAEQPDVRLLVCSGAFDSPLTAAPIRLPEMREALGAYAEVRVSASTAAGQ